MPSLTCVSKARRSLHFNRWAAILAEQMVRPAYLYSIILIQGAHAMENLTDLLDSIDAAYRIAAKTDREVASLLLLASLNVSQKLEAKSAGHGRRKAN